jgi:RNA polymerase sigma factor (sigma-70 family)
MEKLPRQCKKVFTLHYVEGKKISEIAEELKISIGTANTHKFRGIHLIKKALLGMPLLIFISFPILN